VSGIDFTLIDASHREANRPSDRPTVWAWRNETGRAVEIALAPGAAETGHSLQIHSRNLADPHWHVRFEGRLIKPAGDTHLTDFEDIRGDLCAPWTRT
jgi:hypothetical protein